MDHLSSTLTTLKDQAKDALWALSAGWSSCVMCQQEAKVKINGRTCELSRITSLNVIDFFPYSSSLLSHNIPAKSSSWGVQLKWNSLNERNQNKVKIIKVLGEGGFSFVYLAQDEGSGVSFIVMSYSMLPSVSKVQSPRNLSGNHCDINMILTPFPTLASIRPQKNPLSNRQRWRQRGHAGSTLR